MRILPLRLLLLAQPILGMLLTLIPLSTSAQSINWQSPSLINHPLVGQIIDVRTEQTIKLPTLLEKLQQSHWVLIGEKHDNPDHHQIERFLLNKLLTEPNREPRAVVLEMLNNSQQPLIKHLSTNDSLAAIKDKLQWPKHGWSWPDYGALIKLSLTHNAPLKAGNLNKAQIRQFYQLTEAQFQGKQFKTLAAIPTEQRNEIRMQIDKSHCHQANKQHLNAMVSIQLAKDAQMADSMLHSPSGAILISGAYHSYKTLGVPTHLSQRSQESMAVLVLKEVSATDTNISDYFDADNADFIWLTPKQHSIDPCSNQTS